ncbi:RNA polymerase sigma factor [Chitinophaga pinensis]|uniref:RNA polymerase, sigma-24 subunit, ECF subfamily n=1 Tax=Chitinophaga pinensis (strain ATCC 43595 / DSM 2588 / LMG 13176 / NBRC 15968 / NCIMB 11800 / UQM 2034) TaxID=485918 RepID=A0A979G5L2_CHIPD|nr:sigma-70 family RNA polymerase sigma factor [Chitinophaga pinensis]ACU61093.1 RNA polymerase, sigma-24 subunit, ECF subfamily [Chitinophaga pinensis DSM 2588]
MMENLTDAELLSLAQTDDEKAFEAIMYRYNVQLYKYIYTRIRNEHDAKDLLQEIFISCWKNRHTINNIAAYLKRSVHYAIIDWQVGNKKALARNTTLEEKDEPTTYPVENQLISLEIKEEVETEISKMNETMRKIFVSSRWESKSIPEIAQEYGLSEQTVKNNLSMALKRIRLRLAAYFFTLVYILLTLSLQFLNGTTFYF